MVTNISENPVDIASVYIAFKQGNHNIKKFCVHCNMQIPASGHESVQIPFQVGTWANTGINIFDAGVEYGTTQPRHFSRAKLELGAGRVVVVESEPNGKRIFVSHSNSLADASVVRRMRKKLRDIGFEPYIAEDDPRAGNNLWTKILGGIKSSQLVIVLWTESGAKSCDVREEVGMAVAMAIKLVPVVEVDLAGSMKGLEYVPLEREDLENSIAVVAERVASLLGHS